MSEPNKDNTPRPPQWSLADKGFTKVERLDYFGNPYTAWQRKQPVNLGALWTKFKDRMNQEDREQRQAYSIIQADTDLHDESQQLDADKWNEKIEQYYDNLLNEER